jgi:preprotein translocase subunit SecF
LLILLKTTASFINLSVDSNTMIVLSDIVKLHNYEDEDIFDIVVKLEKSFGIKFEKDAFYKVKTFGDMCDVFENHINYDHRDDCTKQQAFYRVRNAISETQFISSDKIELDTKLGDLFPRCNRRQKAMEFKRFLGTDIKILTYPGWLALIFGVGFLLSLVAFFFDWKIALTGIVFFIAAIKVADKLGKDLEC